MLCQVALEPGVGRNIFNRNQFAWDELSSTLSDEPELAIDTESNSLYCYRERTCLIQIGTRQDTFIIDPLKIINLAKLGSILANPDIVKVFHGSDYDLRSLDRDYGFRINNLFDTHVAAKFIGSSTPNLASVLEDTLNISIPKNRRLQTSDWRKRPISDPALDYAANDVIHLLAMAKKLKNDLMQLGRLDWVKEECERLEGTRYSPPNPPDISFLKVKGSDKLHPRGMAILKELFMVRDSLAAKIDCPPSRVLSNDSLLNIVVTTCDPLTKDLDPLNGLPPISERKFGDIFRQGCIKRVKKGPNITGPPRERRGIFWTKESKLRLQRFKQWGNGSRSRSWVGPPSLMAYHKP
ncbi:MAG: ribonuclease D [Chloroflexota bacterium]|nr:MAG: ribonuclease D [Chloroflexota bacterium]